MLELLGWDSLLRAARPADPACRCLALQTERAEATAALFTRDGEQTNNLFDMQARAAPARLPAAALHSSGRLHACCVLPHLP